MIKKNGTKRNGKKTAKSEGISGRFITESTKRLKRAAAAPGERNAVYPLSTRPGVHATGLRSHGPEDALRGVRHMGEHRACRLLDGRGSSATPSTARGSSAADACARVRGCGRHAF